MKEESDEMVPEGVEEVELAHIRLEQKPKESAIFLSMTSKHFITHLWKRTWRRFKCLQYRKEFVDDLWWKSHLGAHIFTPNSLLVAKYSLCQSERPCLSPSSCCTCPRQGLWCCYCNWQSGVGKKVGAWICSQVQGKDGSPISTQSHIAACCAATIDGERTKQKPICSNANFLGLW